VGGGVQARAVAEQYEVGVPALAAVGLVAADDQVGRGVAVVVARGEVGRRLVGEDGRPAAAAVAAVLVDAALEDVHLAVGGADHEVLLAVEVAGGEPAPSQVV
jgi:hypothetical protein